MENQENVPPPPPVVLEEKPWWTDLADEAAGGTVPLEGILKVETFSRTCYRLFFQQKMTKEIYFQCCCAGWMIQCLDQSGGLTAAQLWDATLAALQVAGDESCMAGWILPTLKLDDLKALAKQQAPSSSEVDPEAEERKLYLLTQLWKRFYKACEEREQQQTITSRPTKRRRTTYQYFSSSKNNSNSRDGIMKGVYKLPMTILLSSILLHCNNTQTAAGFSWEDLHEQVHRLPKIFKTLTAEDIHAALVVVGMQCLVQQQEQRWMMIPGLTPCLLLERYVTRTGESVLSVLKEALNLDYYPLRATICEHLLEPVYSPDESIGGAALTEDEMQTTIRACCDFLNREQTSGFLQTIKEPPASDEQRKDDDEARPSDNSSSSSTSIVPERCLSPRYPLLTHLGAWLLQDDIWRAMELVRVMEKHPHLDGLWKDEAYLHIWQHLLRQGNIFLDGNHDTPNYFPKRELLYNGVVSGMGAYGRGSMLDFYQTLAQTVWDHPRATPNEKHYVLMACQQTLLRLLFKCRGLGTMTVVQFLQDTTWPVPLQENNHKKSRNNGNGVSLLSSSTTSDLDVWAAEFLSHRNPIPESLLSSNKDADEESNNGFSQKVILDLTRLVEEEAEETVVESWATAVEVVAQTTEEEEVRQELADEPAVAALSPQNEFMAPPRQEEPKDVDVDQQQEEEEENDQDEEDEYHDEIEPKENEDVTDMGDEHDSEEDYESDDGFGYKSRPNQDEIIGIDDEEEEEDEDEDDDDDDDDDDDVVEIIEDSKPAAAPREDMAQNDATREMDDDDEDDFYEYEDEDRSTEMPGGVSNEASRRTYSSSSEEEHQDQKPSSQPIENRANNRMYLDEEEQDSVEDPDRGFFEDEEEADDDSSSDGGDGGGENEAVVIQDSEDEDDDAPVESAGGIAEHARHNAGSDAGEEYSDSDQFENEDSGSDVHEDSSQGGPHRIARARGEIDDASSEDSGEEAIREAPNAIEDARGGDQHPAPIGVGVGVDVNAPDFDEEEEDQHGPVVEIIDDSEEDEHRPGPEVASVQRDPESPSVQSAKREETQEDVGSPTQKDKESASAITAMLDVADKPPTPAGATMENDKVESGAHHPPQVEETKLADESEEEDDAKMPAAESSVNDEHHESEQEEDAKITAIESLVDEGHHESEQEKDAKIPAVENLVNEGRHESEQEESAKIPAAESSVNEENHDSDQEEDAKVPAVESSINEERENAESDATDDEEERVIEVEKAETEDAAVGGEFGGDTTEEENDQATSGRANMLADADRRADVLRARTGYASQLEEGYEPEDTHGYTEEEVSEAIHTEDEEEERRAAQEAQKVGVSVAPREVIEPVQHSGPHSSDDMDEADEHEEDLGAESSELEETAEARDYVYSPTSEHEKDPTTLLEFAQSAQRLHQKGRQSTTVKATQGMADPSEEKADVKAANHAPIEVDEEKKVADNEDEEPHESDNFASVEDAKEADFTMATESLEMTEDTADQGDSEAGPTDIEGVPKFHDDLSGEHEQPMEKTATEMILDSNVGSQNANIFSAVNQDNSMEMEGPAPGHEMEVDENLEDAEDVPMVEGDAASKDATMEPASPTDAEAMVTVAAENNDNVEMTEISGGLTMDEVLTGEGLLEGRVPDAEMDTQPSPTAENLGMHVDAADEEKDESEGVTDVDATQSKEISNGEGVAEREGPQIEDVDEDNRGQFPLQPTDEHIGDEVESDSNDSVPISTMVKSRKSTEANEDHTPLPPKEDESANEEKDDDDDDSVPISAMVQSRRIEPKDEEKDEESKPPTKAESATRRSKRQRTTTDASDVSEDDEKPAAASTRSTQSTSSKSGGEHQNDESATASRPTRHSTRAKAKQSDESETSAKRGQREAGEEEDDGQVASSAIRTRTRAKKLAAGDESVISNTSSTRRTTRASKDKEDDGDNDEEVKPTRRSTRAKASRTDESEDDESVASSRPTRRSTRTSKNKSGAEEDEDDQSVASTASRTRGLAKKAPPAADEDDQSVASTASRTRGQAKKAPPAADEDDQSVASTASRTRVRAKKPAAADDDSVASVSSTTRRSTRARKPTEKAEENDEPSRPRTRPKKGLPPRPPTTRTSARTRKKT